MTTFTRRTLRLTLVLLLPAGCTRGPETAIPSEPPSGFGYAYAGPSCAPWDGFAVSLGLRADSLAPSDSMIAAGDSPQVRLELYPRRSEAGGPSGLAPGILQWPNDPEVAAGARCENGQCVRSPRGRVHLRETRPDGSMRGELEVMLENGDTVRGSFDARWRNRVMLCG